MASITNEKNGGKTIQFYHPDGTRKSLRLGKTTKRHAEAVKVKVESLVFSLKSGHSPDDETALWLSKLERMMLEKLSAVGLIPEPKFARLKDFSDEYIEKRHDLKAATITGLRQSQSDLIAFFGPEKSLLDITPGDAEDFRLFLLGRGLKENTVRRRCGRAKQFLNAAIKKRLLKENPFSEVKSSVQPNPDNAVYVTRETIHEILEVLPDVEWRLIVALCRFGGFRCPTEVLFLKWEHIDWEQGRILVHSPKTEHHPGKEKRLCPLFAELRPFLEEARNQAESDAEFVITRYRKTEANLRTQFHRYIRKAGFEPWPFVFHNLRASCATDLNEDNPEHVVCKWLGHSQVIARKHYLRVTDEHFQRAAGKSGAKSGAMAVRKQVPQPSAIVGKPSREKQKTPAKQGFSLRYADICDQMRARKMVPTGLEPVTSSV